MASDPTRCGALHDGVPRVTPNYPDGRAFSCDLPAGHEGKHEDVTTDAPSTIAWNGGAGLPPTYAAVLRSYAATVDAGGDRDLDVHGPGARRLLARLVRAVAAGHSGAAFVASDPILTVVYPPSDRTRDDAVALLRRIIVQTIAERGDFGLNTAGWDAVVRRAAEVLRNV